MTDLDKKKLYDWWNSFISIYPVEKMNFCDYELLIKDETTMCLNISDHYKYYD